MSAKKKRNQRTSANQYEIYLAEVEQNEVLRINTVNPTLDDNTIGELWQTLTKKLNSCSEGPVLTDLQWKKRFAD